MCLSFIFIYLPDPGFNLKNAMEPSQADPNAGGE